MLLDQFHYPLQWWLAGYFSVSFLFSHEPFVIKISEYGTSFDVCLLWQSGEMAWNLPQHSSSYLGSPKCVGERCSVCGGGTGQSGPLMFLLIFFLPSCNWKMLLVRFPDDQLILCSGCTSNLPSSCMCKNFLFPAFVVWLIGQVIMTYFVESGKLIISVLRTCNSSDVSQFYGFSRPLICSLFHSSFQITQCDSVRL